MIETGHICLVLSMVYEFLLFRNIRKIRLQIPIIEFRQIIETKRRQLLFKRRQMIFPQMLVVYGRKLRFHRIKYLILIIRPILASIEEVGPIIVVSRKLVVVVGKRYSYLNRIQQVSEIVDSLVKIAKPQRNISIQLRYPGRIIGGG